jgi:two-component system, OmpR family, KDP operon response regulator KdpE
MGEGRVLVVDDDPQILRAVRTSLQGHSYEVLTAGNGETALDLLPDSDVDLIVLDLGLPGIGGQEVIKRVRAWSEVPIIVLSVRDGQHDKVEAFDAGADDYVTKPFDTAELLARIRAAKRRSLTEAGEPVFTSGPLCVDFSARQVKLAGAEIKLTPTEYSLLRVLVQNAGKVVTHRQLLRTVWGEKAESQAQYLRVYVTHLRKKLQTSASAPSLIKTEVGIGYRLSVG